jgi:hypothetical protein
VGEAFILIVVVPLAAVGIIGLVFLLVKPTGRPVAERRRKLAAMAGSLGLRFLSTADERMVDFLPDCGVLDKGYDRRVCNLMVESRRPPRTVLFDYECSHLHDPISDRPSEVDERALYAVAMAALHPQTEVAPATFHPTDWFGMPVGVRDAYRLEFLGDEAFRQRFAVVGQPRPTIAAMLEESVRAALLGWTGRGIKPTAEVLPGWVVVWRETTAGEADADSTANALLQYATGIARELDSAALLRRRRADQAT